MARFKSFGRKAHMPFDIVSPIKKPAERAAEIEVGSLTTARSFSPYGGIIQPTLCRATCCLL
jgi:hypothetical protein